MSRYGRQILLPEVGVSGQNTLGAAHALVIGAGGLGSPVLPYLAAAGLGQITLVDPDVVSLSNLHRQVLFRQDDIGQSKAQVAAQALRGLNPDCRVTPIANPLTPANAMDLVQAADIVLDCADSFAVSYILSDACLALDKPLISASVLGFQGYVGGFCGQAPSLRALFPELPDRAASCDSAGVMGPVVGTIGAMQAQMALNTLLGLSPSPLGQLVRFDLHSLRIADFRFDGAAEPEAALSFIAPEALTASDFVVDLRSPEEAATPITALALRLTVDELKFSRPSPATGQRAVLVCRSGLRAWQAARAMQSYWTGDITLIALGDPAPHPKGPLS
ncbi:HesA/MoeB/ThiF family protein [Parasedimentitalea psychrophila]|uniref:HesA/MoeB/ThiF family protein n=1 Tax=Parasedimentitalea psychrophila TaxID=2997337 RepID=A0A9Y2P175_9RHOB|nr:HesA/MoeB/ThiF family protein [Parasedimentitalea psychrophila]WIY23852.1 HesA/MoeB/ThiF family protein [Parasedimentitalea psychrophila]